MALCFNPNIFPLTPDTNNLPDKVRIFEGVERAESLKHNLRQRYILKGALSIFEKAIYCTLPSRRLTHDLQLILPINLQNLICLLYCQEYTVTFPLFVNNLRWYIQIEEIFERQLNCLYGRVKLGLADLRVCREILGVINTTQSYFRLSCIVR